MSPNHFDDRFADTLLGGGVHPDDAPPGLQDVARMIQAARLPASAGELAGEERLVAAFAAAVGVPRALTPNVRRRRPMLASLLSAKVAAVAATLLLGGGVAAAATGSLPSPVQSALARDLSHVGISVPDPGSHVQAPSSSAGSASSAGSPTSGSGTPGTPAVAPGHGPTVPGPSTKGLCTAYAASGRANGPKGKPVAFAQLEAAATAKGESVEQFCASVTTPTTTPTSGPTTTPTTDPSTTPTTEQGHGGPPSSVPVGPPSSVPAGPPTTEQGHGGPPSSVPVGPPSSVGRH